MKHQPYLLRGSVLVLLAAFFNATAWSQAPTPSQAEVALRKRVQEFYALLRVKRIAEAEKYVTSDTLEQFRLMPNGEFVSMEIDSVEMAPDQKSAAVMINLLVSNASLPVPFPFPRKTSWRQEASGWKIAIPNQTIESAGAGVMFPGGNKAGPAPQKDLTFSNPILEIKPIREGEKKQATFAFANTSEHPVTITAVQSDCKCIEWKPGNKTYKPGEAGTIVVEFDSTGRRYNYSQSIKVITSPGAQEVMLVLTANITPAF